MRQVANKSDPDLRKNAIPHATYQVGIEETVDESNHQFERVCSPVNWSNDHGVTSYTTLHPNSATTEKHQPTSLTYGGKLALAVK